MMNLDFATKALEKDPSLLPSAIIRDAGTGLTRQPPDADPAV
jgi:hypothetical protein